MRNFINLFLIISSVSLTMIACKKEAIFENSNQIFAETKEYPNVASAASIRTAPKTYVLTRKANDSLSYNSDGRIAKVQHSATSYTQYSYGMNSVIAKTYNNNTLTGKITYMMNFNNARTYESSHIKYNYVGGGVQAIQTTWQYQYDSIGRVAFKINKATPKQRFIYQYHPTTVTVWKVDEFGSPVDRAELRYYNSDALNKMNLNSEGSTLDQYLNIFGKPSKYLLSGLDLWTVNACTWTAVELFSYSYNADGYPTKVVRHNQKDGTQKTELFGYIIK